MRIHSVKNLRKYLTWLHVLHSLESENLDEGVIKLIKRGRRFAEKIIEGKELLSFEDVKILDEVLEYPREEFVEKINEILDADVKRKINEYPKLYEFEWMLINPSETLSEIKENMPPLEKTKKYIMAEVDAEYVKEVWKWRKKWLKGEMEYDEYNVKRFKVFDKIYSLIY